jgi:hypothetical protein
LPHGAGTNVPEAVAEAARAFPDIRWGTAVIFVARALDGGWGFFNRALFNLYFHPDRKTAGREHRFSAVVENVADLRWRKAHVRTARFGRSESKELLDLIGEANDWRLREVIALQPQASEAWKQLWAARVVGDHDPVLIGHCQPGLLGIEEFLDVIRDSYLRSAQHVTRILTYFCPFAENGQPSEVVEASGLFHNCVCL